MEAPKWPSNYGRARSSLTILHPKDGTRSQQQFGSGAGAGFIFEPAMWRFRNHGCTGANRAAVAVHVRGAGAADSHRRRFGGCTVRRSTSSRKFVSRSSRPFGSTQAFRPTSSPAASSRRSERVLTTTVNDIEHIEAKLLQRHRGRQNLLPAVGRYQRRECAGNGSIADDTEADAARLNAAPRSSTTTPRRCRYCNWRSAGWPDRTESVRSRLNMIRIRLVTVPGAAVPYPYGGKTRQIQIDLD